MNISQSREKEELTVAWRGLIPALARSQYMRVQRARAPGFRGSTMQLFYPTPKVYDRSGACPVLAARARIAGAAMSRLPLSVRVNGRAKRVVSTHLETYTASTQRGGMPNAEKGSGTPIA